MKKNSILTPAPFEYENSLNTHYFQEHKIVTPKVKDNLKNSHTTELKFNYFIKHVQEKQFAKTARPKAPDNQFPVTTMLNPRFHRLIPNNSRNFPPRITPIIPNAPIFPEECLKQYSYLLTSYELTEIYSFPEIYYVGHISSKIRPTHSKNNNFGFDDAKNNYKIQIGDHLAYRFEIKSIIHSGSYGTVVKCRDHKTGKLIAIKIMNSKKEKEAQNEANILSLLMKNNVSNVLSSYEFFIFRNHFCLTFEVLGKSILEILPETGFSSQMIPWIANQLATCLQQFHSLGIIHLNIKPTNILSSRGGFKLIDFMNSYLTSSKNVPEFKISLFYRPPEVVLGLPFGPPADIWSYALVLVECSTGKPLLPATNELELLAMITETIGLPPPEFLQNAPNKFKFFSDDALKIDQIKETTWKESAKPLRQILGNDLFYELISKCLTWDPQQRINFDQIVIHPFLKTIEKIPF